MPAHDTVITDLLLTILALTCVHETAVGEDLKSGSYTEVPVAQRVAG